MLHISLMSIFLALFLIGSPALGAQQDYIDQLTKLSELSSNQQYRQAINGYKRLEAQPGVPEWLKAGCEYEIAELYAVLNETDNAIAALNRAVQLGYNDCLSSARQRAPVDNFEKSAGHSNTRGNGDHGVGLP